ncbi:hypothetical protein N9W19_00140 [bacterium]|nr:hypothetical protein [bacterium]
MSKIEVNAIEPQCGTTLTVGASGDTITFPTGTTIVNNGTQTGFGRTGTVDWNTTAITSTPTTGVNGVGYFIDSSGGVRTINLPASPSAGDIMAISDYAQNAATNNITIGRNGSNIQGDASDLVLARNGVAMTLVYVDATKGWVVTDTGAEADKEPDPAFITATGGTITCCGDYKIHTFTSPGTFCVSNAGNPVGSNKVSYMVVAGGGGAGKADAGGGGGGGFREGKTPSTPYTASPIVAPDGLPVSVQGYPITIGGGGSGGPSPASGNPGTKGSDSIFSTITSTGGGLGSGNCGSGGGPGGSGGGGSTVQPAAGSGNTPSVSPPQGNNGGTSGGGGGGATTAGATGPGPSAGGTGATTCITGSPITKSAGGEGDRPGGSAGADGAANSGNGGQGVCGGGPGPGPAGAGGSGIVIIRYKFQ